MPNQTITLSSVGTSAPAHLDWRSGKPITATTTITSTIMTVDYTLQYTLYDTMLSTDAVGTASSNAAWRGVTSSLGSSITHFSSVQGDAGLTFTFTNPIAGLRLSSTAISSSSVVLRVIQGDGW